MLRKAAPDLDGRSSAKFELLGVFITWLQGNEIASRTVRANKKRVVGIGLASPQMSAGVLAA